MRTKLCEIYANINCLNPSVCGCTTGQVATAKSSCELRRGAERSARARLAAASSSSSRGGDEGERAEAENALREIEKSRKVAELAVLEADGEAKRMQAR